MGTFRSPRSSNSILTDAFSVIPNSSLKTWKVSPRRQSATTLQALKHHANARKEKVAGDNTPVKKEKDAVALILATASVPHALPPTPKDEADQKEKALTTATKTISPAYHQARKPADLNANDVYIATKMVTTPAIATRGKMMKISPKLKPPTINPTSISRWTNMR
jgi:hypothetical protein